MKFGIDFGTTRIVVAAADRGNYPLVPFETADGTFDWFPPLVALKGTERCYGWDAWSKQGEPGWTIIRSLKRYLENAGPESCLLIGGGETVALPDLLQGLVGALRNSLAERFPAPEPFEVMLGVPANANSNQRFLTVEAFRRAGFTVLGLLNEPSAASIEFGHRQRTSGRILVYDLGGGTFDVSLVELDTRTHTVLASEGISTLGGDDFDLVLAELAVGSDVLGSLDLAELFRLDEECRRQKEALHPNSRRIVIDLDVVREGMGQATIPVADYYARCRPLLAETLEPTRAARRARRPRRPLRHRWRQRTASGRPRPARGIRPQSEAQRIHPLRHRHRTRDPGRRHLRLRAARNVHSQLRRLARRRRRPPHDFRSHLPPRHPPARRGRASALRPPPLSARAQRRRFPLPRSQPVGSDGQPSGDITVWDEILFPFDPMLADESALESQPVDRNDVARIQHIEEQYACDAAGVVTVTIRNLTSHYGREYSLGKWSGKTAVIRPSATRKRSHKSSN